ncbi:MAG: DUF4157 domain-containing protein [Chloroflexi bacterium]|nr:DUF4157 domain-containing protein [Chloroflexota bacterium]
MARFDRIHVQQAEEEALKKGHHEESSDVESSHDASTNSVLQMQRTHGNQAVQRMIAAVQRSVMEEGGSINDEISQRINSKRGGGSGLDGSVQASASGALGYDFSGVKVHTDSESDQLNKALGAKAFTTGSDIYFSANSYSPGTSEGQELIHHELTHVVQQGGQAPSGGLTLGPADDAYEREADHMAKSASAQGTASQPATAQAKRVEEVQTLRDLGVQREGMPEEEEEAIQAMRDPNIQRQEEPEEEELAQ